MRGTWQARESAGRESDGEEKMDEDGKSAHELDEVTDLMTPDASFHRVRRVDTKRNPPIPSSSNNPTEETRDPEVVDANADALVSSMSSLSLVPPSIRFGRGGSRQAFPHSRRGRVATNSSLQRGELQEDEAPSTKGGGRGTPRGSKGRGVHARNEVTEQPAISN